MRAVYLLSKAQQQPSLPCFAPLPTTTTATATSGFGEEQLTAMPVVMTQRRPMCCTSTPRILNAVSPRRWRNRSFSLHCARGTQREGEEDEEDERREGGRGREGRQCPCLCLFVRAVRVHTPVPLRAHPRAPLSPSTNTVLPNKSGPLRLTMAASAASSDATARSGVFSVRLNVMLCTSAPLRLASRCDSSWWKTKGSNQTNKQAGE